jgi:hypothetical protein
VRCWSFSLLQLESAFHGEFNLIHSFFLIHITFKRQHCAFRLGLHRDLKFCPRKMPFFNVLTSIHLADTGKWLKIKQIKLINCIVHFEF